MKNFDEVNGIKYMNYICQRCQEIFAIPARRGKPPKYCTICTRNGAYLSDIAAKKEQERLAAEEKVRKLEERLLAKGSHISQHRTEWE